MVVKPFFEDLRFEPEAVYDAEPVMSGRMS